MKTIVEGFNVLARTGWPEVGVNEAWCEVPHTAEILGLSQRSDGGFKLVCRYTKEDDTPATLEKRTLYLLRDGGVFLEGAKPRYVGTAIEVVGSFGTLHVFEEVSK